MELKQTSLPSRAVNIAFFFVLPPWPSPSLLRNSECRINGMSVLVKIIRR
jgi:hypothetical protein